MFNNFLKRLEIFPTSVKDKLTIGIKKLLENMTIYNVMGQKVIFYKELKNNKVDVFSCPSGFYILNAEIDETIQSLKFLKKKFITFPKLFPKPFL